MPQYFFDVKKKNRVADAIGLDCSDDTGAIAAAKFFAIRISVEVPIYDGPRHVIVLNDAGAEIFQTLVPTIRESKLHRASD